MEQARGDLQNPESTIYGANLAIPARSLAFKENRHLPADALPVDEECGARLERVDQLAALLSDLPAKVRAALIWAHRDGHTYEEIGKRLVVSKNRVKKYLTKALAHCRSGMTLEAVTG